MEVRRISITGQETLEEQRKQGTSIESMEQKLDALGKSLEVNFRGTTQAWLHEEDSPPKHHFRGKYISIESKEISVLGVVADMCAWTVFWHREDYTPLACSLFLSPTMSHIDG